MDSVISQFDKEYLNALIAYNKLILQRNALLKSSDSNIIIYRVSHYMMNN